MNAEPTARGGGGRGGGLLAPGRVGAVLGLLVIAFAAWFFFTRYERVEVEVRAPPSEAAQRNPFLALERALTRLGVPARSQSADQPLPSDGAVVIWLTDRPGQERAAQVAEWVAAGEQLVWLGEDIELDADGQVAVPWVFEAAAASALAPVAVDEAVGDAISDEVTGATAEAAADEVGDSTGDDDGAAGPDPDHDADLGSPAPAVELVEGVTLTTWRHGDGVVTGLGPRSRWRSEHLDGDAMVALWRALGGGSERRAVLVVWPQAPTFATMLGREHRWGIWAVLLWLLCWWWRNAPRLGPVASRAAAPRRSLLAHIAASGALLWRLGEGDALVTRGRAALLRRTGSRFPVARQAGDEALSVAVSAATGLPPAVVDDALFALPNGEQRRLVVIVAAQLELNRALVERATTVGAR
jgi:hypothetical protein